MTKRSQHSPIVKGLATLVDAAADSWPQASPQAGKGKNRVSAPEQSHDLPVKRDLEVLDLWVCLIFLNYNNLANFAKKRTA